MNQYTITPITTNSIGTNVGFLDAPDVFPPLNGFKLTVVPDPGVDILAREFKIGNANNPIMVLNRTGAVNSHTEWPSRFEWVPTTLNQSSTTTVSGFVEFDGIYKVVIEDSDNTINDPNWTPSGATNLVFIHVYMGKNQTTPIQSLVDLIVKLDIDRQDDDPLTQLDTQSARTPGSATGTGVVNNFTITNVNI